MSIVGLLLLEQFFRNSNEGELWATKHLCLGLGILFAYDFFMYAEALLFRQLDRNSWQVRGIVTAMAAILIAISISRTDDRNEAQDNPQGIHLSRHVAFHSLTLMASGIYLITMSLAAYFYSTALPGWKLGECIANHFSMRCGPHLVVLLFSGQIRASARVWLSKNFFSYKYDYRLEWLQFTHTLASGRTIFPKTLPALWRTSSKAPEEYSGARQRMGDLISWPTGRCLYPARELILVNLSIWLQEEGWIIDLREWRRAPDLYRKARVTVRAH